MSSGASISMSPDHARPRRASRPTRTARTPAQVHATSSLSRRILNQAATVSSRYSMSAIVADAPAGSPA
jgi:hypothetical protein